MNYLINYCLNKFCPYVAIGMIMIFTFEPHNWLSFLIVPLVFYIDRVSFKTGYSVAYCECKGVDLNRDPT